MSGIQQILLAAGGVSASTAPANTVVPVISGTTQVGSTLSTTDGTWTGSPSPTFTYQWLRGGSNISGATANTYMLVTADAGATVTVTVTATNTAGSASVTSTGVGPISVAPVNTAAPAISGTTTVGSTLTTTDGTWTGSPAPGYTYQWKRGGTNISGAISSSYLLVTADLAAMITVTVTATNAAGSASATSAGVGPITGSTNYTATYLSQGIY